MGTNFQSYDEVIRNAQSSAMAIFNGATESELKVNFHEFQSFFQRFIQFLEEFNEI